jgi:hypothetical protein
MNARDTIPDVPRTQEEVNSMSHAGRRIASAVAATAAIAVPVAAAASAQADSLPALGGLPVVGGLAGTATGALPVNGLPVAGGVLSGPLSGLPVVGSLTSGLAPQGQNAAPSSDPMQLAAPSGQSAATAQLSKAASTVQAATHHYTPKHGKAAV